MKKERKEDIVNFIHNLTFNQQNAVVTVDALIDSIITNLPDALTLLTVKQKIVFNKLIFQNESLSQIAKSLLLDRKTVRDHFDSAVRKIKKFYLNDDELTKILSNLN